MGSEEPMIGSRLAGRVLDRAGQPVAGVEVRAEPGPHTTTTDVEGAFAFDGLARRTFSVSGRKDEYYAWPTYAEPSESIQPVTLQLRLGTTLIVNVSAERAPVVGATLRLEHGIKAVSDEAGRVTVRGLAPGSYRGSLVADGLGDEHLSLSFHDDPGSTVERTINLEPGARIEGVVLDSDGKPVEEAVVLAWSGDPQRPPCQAWTAADGTWHISARAGTYRCWAQSQAHGKSSDQTFTSDGKTRQRNVTFRLGPSRIGTVIGSVVSAAKRVLGVNKERNVAGVVIDENGAPAAEADVRVLGRRFVRADSNGRFEVEDLEPGEYEIIADWVGPWSGPRKNGVRQRIRTGDANIKLVLPAGATITGRAILEGKPLNYFGLRLVGERESSYGGFPIGVRDDKGQFTLRHVLPGTWKVALMSNGTRLATSSEFTVTTNDTVDLGDILLTRGQQLSGHVRGQSGAPVSGARVIIGRASSWAADRSQLERLFTGQYETRTDAAGAYSFEGVDSERHPMGTSEIMWATHLTAGVSLMHEVPKTDATIDFVLLGSGRIEGSIQNMRGARGHVMAIREDEPPWARHAHCDKEGHFSFENLPEGAYVVKLDAPEVESVQPTNVTVSANQTAEATLVMNSVSVRLRVKVPSGRGKDLVIEPTSEGAGIGGRVRGIMTMNEQETCSFDYVRPGTYRASFDGLQWTTITVATSPDEQTFDLR
jgi:protocatechuate 3,4-dioxygenase beta subunit